MDTLHRVEQGFNIQGTLDWIARNWTVAIYCSVIYVVMVYAGKSWMTNRQAYTLRKPLLLWNIALAVFSLMGSQAIIPSLLRSIYEHGISHVTCNIDIYADKHLSLWGWLFVMSKLVEFGDTSFIVLRKTPLSFLHWYHHVTVCVYSWYGLTSPFSSLTVWFTGINYIVHTVMYTYYALRISGFRFHPWIPKTVTLLQLSQMFVGIFVNLVALRHARAGHSCMFRYDLFYLAIAMYSSYVILFSNFFYQRYIRKALSRSLNVSREG